MRVEQTGHDEVKQCPEFLHAILNGCTREEKTIAGFKAEEGFPAGAGWVFDSLGFVENEELPVDRLEVLVVLGDLT